MSRTTRSSARRTPALPRWHVSQACAGRWRNASRWPSRRSAWTTMRGAPGRAGIATSRWPCSPSPSWWPCGSSSMPPHPQPGTARRPGRWAISVCARSAISSAVCCLWLDWLSRLSSPGLSGAACTRPSPDYATGKHAVSVPLEHEKLNCSILPDVATAHAILEDSTPAINATIKPGELDLRLRYNSRIDRARSRPTLIRPDHGRDPVPIALDGPPDVIAAHLDLAPGRYVLRWQVLAVDGHITRGDLPFTVTVP